MITTVRRRGACAAASVLLTGFLLAGSVAPAAAQDGLDDLLEEVGETYARAYTAPVLYSFGPNLNSALYSTAAIPRSRLTIGFGLKLMATHLNESDQAFRRVIPNVDLTQYDDTLPPGTTGTVVMSGPTVFGDADTPGTIEGYVSGVQVFSQEAIEGLVDTRYSPLVAPELSVGGVVGLRATLRYFPEIELSDLGKIKFMGFGLQWNANTVVPTLPVDVMVGFFRQSLDIGDAVEADASSIFLAASRSFPFATVYAGVASESSDMTVSYTYIDGGERVTFDIEGRQDSRLTLGATLDLLAKLNVELAHGDVTTLSAGLLFGF